MSANDKYTIVKKKKKKSFTLDKVCNIVPRTALSSFALGKEENSIFYKNRKNQNKKNRHAFL